nr:MAG TPA: hypothetical protein [Bacteriophage sp.]
MLKKFQKMFHFKLLVLLLPYFITSVLFIIFI